MNADLGAERGGNGRVYAGYCIGGPLDGQQAVGEAKTFTVSCMGSLIDEKPVSGQRGAIGGIGAFDGIGAIGGVEGGDNRMLSDLETGNVSYEHRTFGFDDGFGLGYWIADGKIASEFTIAKSLLRHAVDDVRAAAEFVAHMQMENARLREEPAILSEAAGVTGDDVDSLTLPDNWKQISGPVEASDKADGGADGNKASGY